MLTLGFPLVCSLETLAIATQCCRLCTSAGLFGRRSWRTGVSLDGRRTCLPVWLICFTALPTRKGKWESYHPRSLSHDYARRMVRGTDPDREIGGTKKDIAERETIICWPAETAGHPVVVVAAAELGEMLKMLLFFAIFIPQSSLTTTCSRMLTSS